MSIEKNVIDYLKETFRLEQVNLDMNFRDDLGFDSLDLVELVAYLEDVLHHHVTDEELSQLTTVRDVVHFLQAKGADI
ncbi:acyl carrier protein [Neobacillus cucumis]|uniref:acyl carrier protein n=1 Tax=Neobacillus cucumis TaxID=1740721 RepID=UPI0028533B00|nr:phosphopantetheine-binding protein [Neobacillus cucumis]MDR4945295.1 phosphopantetheine-binding protein [Neobacillus cucumis]